MLKSGEDEEGRITLMKSRVFRSLDFIILLVPSPGWGCSGDHCDLSGKLTRTDPRYAWFETISDAGSLQTPGVSRRLGAWELRFERSNNVRLRFYSGGGGHCDLFGQTDSKTLVMLGSKQFQTPRRFKTPGRLEAPRRFKTPGRLEAPRRLETMIWKIWKCLAKLI